MPATPRHAYEKQEIGLICLLKQGKPVGTKVQFVVKIDDVEKKKVDGTISADANSRTGKAAVAKYVPDEVAADKTHAVMTYHAVVDGEEYKTTDEIHIWPKKGKLTTLNEAGDKPFAGVRFWVMQNAEKHPKSDDPMVPQLPPYKTAGNPAIFEFPLKAGHAFALQAAEPFEFVADPEQNGTALRDLKVKAKLNFEAEFVTPKRPADGTIKQYVNLAGDPVKKGSDCKGNEIEVTVGVKGDRDEATGVTVPNPLGGAGVFVFVKVKFSGPGGKKSKRTTPKTDLVAGLNLSERVAVKEAATDPQWEYTGKVELKEAGGVGKFKINVGFAGGDTCEIKIGSTAACADATLTFTNWRKIWYELLAPDFMALRDVVVAGANTKDLPTATVNQMNDAMNGRAHFIEYDLHKTNMFTEAEAPSGTVWPRSFFELTSGPANVYVLTDFTFPEMSDKFDKDASDAKGRKGRIAAIKLCDFNLFAEQPDHDAPITLSKDVVATPGILDLGLNQFWLPKSGYDGGDSIQRLTWTAKITPASYIRKPTVEFERVDSTGAATATTKDRELVVTELTQGGSVTIKYKNPTIGHTPSDMDSTRKGAVDGYVTPMLTVAKLRPQQNKLRFRITGELGNDRRTERFDKLEAYITQKVAAAAPNVPMHPGLTDAGVARTGVLPAAAYNLASSNHKRVAINLPTTNPTDPGNFVGALSDTKCPITITVRVTGHHGGLGLAQNKEVLCVFQTAAVVCVGSTILHEIGHNLNLTAYSGSASAHAPGFYLPKKVTETQDIVAYRENGTKGHLYVEHGGSGPHCAFGLSDAAKATPATDSYDWHTTNPEKKCIMYGTSNYDDALDGHRKFCAQCNEFIRGRDASAFK